jgi:hypothetical protein
VAKKESAIIEHDNNCLEEEIAILEGKPAHRIDARAAAREASRALAERLREGSGRRSQYLLDSEEAIRQHNKKHPQSLWAESEDLLRLTCGDCAEERALRDSQLKSESQK